jgi:spiro-SPASM protein
MKLAAFIYAASISPHALEAIAGGGSAYERCLGFVGRLPGLERGVVVEGKLPLPEGPYAKVRREAWTFDQLLEVMIEVGQGVDAILFAWADEPFLDSLLASKMIEDFRRYRAEYGFADGYPIGLAAELVAPRILPAIRSLAKTLPPEIGRGSLFAAIQKDINAFDIETDISPLDLRDLRLELACDSKRNSLLVDRLARVGVEGAESALELIPKNMGLLRTLPSFVQVQVTAGCPQACRLCPYPVFGGDILSRRGDMPRARFAALIDQVVEFSEDAVIDISLWGEPGMHADIGGLVGEVLARPGLSLIVETSGIGWEPKLIEGLASRYSSSGSGSRLDWVVSLDAWSPESYAELRGPGYEEAISCAERLIESFPGHAHVQMVRALENEAELEAFWRGWKKKTEKVIVQKYSRQAGLLPERKVSDLSPLSRKPCWHLKRDLAVLLDGTVPLCRDFSQGDIILGNVFESRAGRPAGIAAAWASGEAFHDDHIESCRPGGTPRLPVPCEACDEYYTYNA